MNTFLDRDSTQRRKGAKKSGHSSFAIRHSQFAICYLLFAICCLLSACDTPTIPSPVSVLPSPTATATATAMPTATPNPTPTATPTQTLTPTSKTVLITPLPDNGMPESMWPPIQQKTSTILTRRDGLLTYEMLPVQTAPFWDYAEWSGRLAFSAPRPSKVRTSCECTDSDLWIYDYTTGEAEMWLSEHVERAVWSPEIAPETGLEYLAVVMPDPSACDCSNRCYNMTIFSAKGRTIKFIKSASPYFSWSPDGQWITYYGGFCAETGQGVYIVPIKEGISKKIAQLDWLDSIYDRPVWAQEHELVFFPQSGIWAAPVDGSGRFRVMTTNKHPVFIESQYAMLWSAKRRQLILAGDGGMDTPSQVVVYELSEDLRTATDFYVAGENVRLLGWLEQDEKLILATQSQITIWSLEDKAPVSP